MKDFYYEHLALTELLSKDLDLYTEKTIKDTILIDEDHNPIEEITKAYVSCNILNYKIVPGINSTSVDGSKISNNICVAEGVINLSIEYIMANEFSQLGALSKQKHFGVFIMLPDDYIEGSDVTIKCSADYININKLSPHKLYYFLHLILSFNIY